MELVNQDSRKPVVTVVTVVFNDVKNIERTIRCVLDQTYHAHIEYIIIDGGSTDGTVDIIKKYSTRLGYWVSEKDKGMFDAMNKGVSHASGEWVQILNSGDYLMSNTIIEEIFKDQDYSNFDIVYGGFVGNFSGQAVLCPANKDVHTNAWQGMQACHSTLFVRNEIAQKFPYDLQYQHSADGDFLARCVVAGCRFKRLEKMVFRVGTLGNSFNNWLPCRLENLKIARTYFPGLKTDWHHIRGIIRESSFRIFKAITSVFGLYQLVRYIYRKKIKKKFLLLPKGIQPYQD